MDLALDDLLKEYQRELTWVGAAEFNDNNVSGGDGSAYVYLVFTLQKVVHGQWCNQKHMVSHSQLVHLICVSNFTKQEVCNGEDLMRLVAAMVKTR